MTQVPTGWYPDPAPQPSGQPALLRYWDGTAWTEHTHPAALQQPEAQPPAAWGQPPTYGDAYGQSAQPYQPQAHQAEGYPGQGYGYPAYTSTGKSTTTPDGQPLASWWSRVGATVIDAIITTVIAALVAFPLYARAFHRVGDFVDATNRAEENGATTPSIATFETHLLGTIVAITLIGLVINMVYNVGFLKWRQATPGGLVLGLRVRLREAPGPLSWRTVWLHWLGQYGPRVLGVVPLVGGLSALYALLDYLWPLWDEHRQALHDKLARTNVVVQRR